MSKLKVIVIVLASLFGLTSAGTLSQISPGSPFSINDLMVLVPVLASFIAWIIADNKERASRQALDDSRWTDLKDDTRLLIARVREITHALNDARNKIDILAMKHMADLERMEAMRDAQKLEGRE